MRAIPSYPNPVVPISITTHFTPSRPYWFYPDLDRFATREGELSSVGETLSESPMVYNVYMGLTHDGTT